MNCSAKIHFFEDKSKEIAHFFEDKSKEITHFFEDKDKKGTPHKRRAYI